MPSNQGDLLESFKNQVFISGVKTSQRLVEAVVKTVVKTVERRETARCRSHAFLYGAGFAR